MTTVSSNIAGKTYHHIWIIVGRRAGGLRGAGARGGGASAAALPRVRTRARGPRRVQQRGDHLHQRLHVQQEISAGQQRSSGQHSQKVKSNQLEKLECAKAA